VARWISEDPSGFPDGSNNNRYINDPLTGFDATGLAWSNLDFIKHFYTGGGAAVSLASIGLDGSVKDISEAPGGGSYNFNNQIDRTAVAIPKPFRGQLEFSDSFNNSYSFRDASFSLGSGSLSGTFVGFMNTSPSIGMPWAGTYSFVGSGTINYSDSFTDPTTVIEYLYGSSTGGAAWLRTLANGGGTPFEITGSWQMQFGGGGTIKYGGEIYE